MPRTVRVPYGRGELDVSVPDHFDLDVAESGTLPPVADLPAEARRLVAAPLASAPLRELAADALRRAAPRRPRVVIAVTDLTRACPDRELVPPLLDALNAGGVADAEISVCIGVGLHRATTEAEKREKLGDAVCARVRVFDSDGNDPAKWADLGPIPPYGAPGFTQKVVKDADLVLATGIVEPHQYAGWSGGRKTVAIGCCGEPTITATHGLRFIEDPGCRLAKLDGNPFHETVTEIARRAGLRFCLNVVVDDRERVVAVAAGTPAAVLDELVSRAAVLYTRPIAKQYDVVLAGVGWPKDVNLYQASRAPTYLRFAPTPVVRRGGVIVVPARLDEGLGAGAGELRCFEALERAASPSAVIEEARRDFAGGQQRAVMIALTLEHCRVIVAASTVPDLVRRAKLEAAETVEAALETAWAHLGRPVRASLLLVPRALHTLPVVGA